MYYHSYFTVHKTDPQKDEMICLSSLNEESKPWFSPAIPIPNSTYFLPPGFHFWAFSVSFPTMIRHLGSWNPLGGRFLSSWRLWSWREFDFVSLASTTEFCPLMLAPCSLVPWMPVLAWSLEGSWTHLKCWKIYSFYVVPNLPRLAQESFL